MRRPPQWALNTEAQMSTFYPFFHCSKTFLLKRRFLGSWGVERRSSERGHRCSWSAWSGVISLYGIICHIYAYMPDISKYVTNIIFGAWSGDTFMSQISYWANIWRWDIWQCNDHIWRWCVPRFRNITEAPAYVFWFHNTRMINYGVGGVEVTANKSPTTRSYQQQKIVLPTIRFFL